MRPRRYHYHNVIWRCYLRGGGGITHALGTYPEVSKVPPGYGTVVFSSSPTPLAIADGSISTMTTMSSRIVSYVIFLALVQTRVVLVLGDCWYDNKKHEENAEVPTGEPCLNCTCNRSALLCYLRVCPNLPDPPPLGCILLHRYKTCCPELICSDFSDGGNSLEARADPAGDLDVPSDDQTAVYKNACISNGSIYGPGSAMHSSSMCEYCYCLAGKQVCVKPKCLLPVDGCTPVFEDVSCCPIKYNCTKSTQISTTEKTTTLKTGQEGCSVVNTYYPEGAKVVGIGHSVCDNCYCLRGILRCEPLSCAPPLLGCTPVVKSGECCAASYNCNGTLEIEPEPNYGLFPTISKEYSKLRKEVQRKPTSYKKDGVVTVAPFYVLAETLQEPTTKLVYQRSPDTYGTTRHFSGMHFKSSSTQKPLEDDSSSMESNYYLISSSKQRSTEKPASTGTYYATTNYEFQNKNFKRVFSSSTSTTFRTKPTGKVRSGSSNSSLTPLEAKEVDDGDYLGLGNLNILSIVDSLLDGKMYRRVGVMSNKTDVANISTTKTTTDLNEFTSTIASNADDTTLGTTTESTFDSATVTTVIDCVNNDDTENPAFEATTVLPISPEEVNKLAEDLSTTTDLSSTEEVTLTQHIYFRFKATTEDSHQLPPEIEAILNNTKYKNKEDLDYDYNEPTLPPSLPNLKIIPFVAADALDAKKESPKDPTPVFIEKKVDQGPLAYSSMFKPPEETEGGFVPKEPSIIEPFYNTINPSVPSDVVDKTDNVITCISEGKEVQHGTPVMSDSPCVTCNCFYGNIVCQKLNCVPPKEGCKLAEERGVSLCCPNYVCDNPIIPSLTIPRIPQEAVTVAEGIIPPDPFRDVIRTEPAPNLQSLIGDKLSFNNKISTTTTKAAINTTSSTTTATTPPENDDDTFGLDKVLQFIFSGNPEVIAKPESQTPESTTATEPSSSTISTTNSYVKVDLVDKDGNIDESAKNKPHSLGLGFLKLAGCNIYGRMYRVGRIISELSGPCLECKCTEIGVQCRQLRCFNNG